MRLSSLPDENFKWKKISINYNSKINNRKIIYEEIWGRYSGHKRVPTILICLPFVAFQKQFARPAWTFSLQNLALFFLSHVRWLLHVQFRLRNNWFSRLRSHCGTISIIALLGMCKYLLQCDFLHCDSESVVYELGGRKVTRCSRFIALCDATKSLSIILLMPHRFDVLSRFKPQG